MGETGSGSEGSGNSGDGITKKDLEAISGVVSELATKVSEMGQQQAETRELEDIMRTNAGPGEEETTPPIPATEGGNLDTNKLVETIIQRVDQVVTSRVAEVDKKVNRALGVLEVTQFSIDDPDFVAKVKPMAYQVSKEPGKANWTIKDLVDTAKGRLAQDALKTMTEENEALRTQVADFQGLAPLSDRPGGFGGAVEPPVEMDSDQAFNKAWKDEGLS